MRRLTLWGILIAASGLLVTVRPEPALTAPDEDGEQWQYLSPAPPAPQGRQFPSLTYDPVTKRMFLFGGRDRLGGMNDLWTLTTRPDESLAWTQLTPEGKAPPARSSHMAVYDDVGQRLVVFGGMDALSDRPLGDLWLLEMSGIAPKWVHVLDGRIGPQPRYSAGAVFDPLARRMVLFGGYNSTTRDFNDTWELDLTADPPEWRELVPAGIPPESRESFLTVYDSVAHRMLVFGGFIRWHQGQVSDLHYLTLAEGREAWVQPAISGPAPEARLSTTGVFDPHQNRLLMYGGWNDINMAMNDVWALPLGPTILSWQRRTPTGASPGARSGMAGAYDSDKSRFVTCCGFVGPMPVSEIWALKLGVPATPTLTPRPTDTPITSTPTPRVTVTTAVPGDGTSTPPPSKSATPRGSRLLLPWLVKDPRPTVTPTATASPTATATPCALEEVEPNDTGAQAITNPPLCEDRNVEGRIVPYEDDDIYWFELDKPAHVEVVLGNIPPDTDFDLSLIDMARTTRGVSDQEGNATERIEAQLEPGRYFLWVSRYRGWSNMAYVIRWLGQYPAGIPALGLGK